MTVLQALAFMFDELAPYSWIWLGWVGGVLHQWLWRRHSHRLEMLGRSPPQQQKELR